MKIRPLRIDDSSNVHSIAYDLERLKLVVTFDGGGRYQYSEVTPLDFIRLVTADSVGKLISSDYVKEPTLHPCEKLGADTLILAHPDDLWEGHLAELKTCVAERRWLDGLKCLHRMQGQIVLVELAK